MSLDAEAYIEIARKGFAAVPDFASTIHVATGRSLKSAIPDLGGIADPVSFTSSMRGYIALSRATDAEGVLVARPFSPTLFQLGEQPFASLLLRILRGQVLEEELEKEWAKAAHKVQSSTKESRLLDSKWHCGACGEKKTSKRISWE